MSITPKEIIRSRRKSIVLIINKDAEFIVRAPYAVSIDFITDIVAKKENWIIKKQNQIKSFLDNSIPMTYKDGERVLFLGSEYLLTCCGADKITILGEKLLIPERLEAKAKDSLIKWYKNQARVFFKERLDLYSEKIGTSYLSLSLSDAKTRWGSCGVKNSINLSWRLILCPRFVLDYVVIHELYHTLYKNHGKIFWSKVKTAMPEFRDAKIWLKSNQKTLMKYKAAD